MKILIWADMHLHTWTYGSKLIDGVNSRLLEQAKVMSRIAAAIRRDPVGHIVFLGDLFHTHSKIDISVLKVAYEGITEIMDAAAETTGARMEVLVGNHDTDRKDMSVHALHWLNSIPGVSVVDNVWHDIEKGFSYLSYTENEDVLKKFFRMSQPICFMHQGLVDVPMASGFVVNEIMNHDMIPGHVRHVFTGHYHPFTVLPKATVVGSVMQHTWADMGDKRGWLMVDTEGQLGAAPDLVQINSKAPEFITLNMCGCDSIGTPLVSSKWVSPGYAKNNYIRVTNYAESGIEKIRKELLDGGAASVEFVIKPKRYKSTVVKAITGMGLSVPELVQEYEKEHSVSKERSNVGKELMK